MIHLLDPGLGDTTFPILDVLTAEDIPQVGRVFSFTVTSWSMFPTIQKGDVLTIEALDRICVGDVVVFALAGTLVCHRVTGTGAGEIVYTRGDAASTPDSPIQRSDILGKVTGVVRGRDRFVPTPGSRPSPAGLVQIKIDFFWTHVRERLLAWALACLAFLKQRALAKRLATLMLVRYVRFYLGVRAPVQSVHAYRFIPLPGVVRGSILANPLPLDSYATDDVLIQARLGRHRLGTFHLASNTMHVRQAAVALGLEEYFHAIRRNLFPDRRLADR